MDSESNRANQDRRLANLAYDLLNAVAAIRARAQLTRRRIHRVETLSRDHIGSDLEQIESQTLRLTRLIDPLHGGSRIEVRRTPPEEDPAEPEERAPPARG